MNKTILAALIGAGATISAAIIGLNAGKSSEQKNIQNEINEVMGDMVNIIGDDNEVTINDIKDLVEDYQNLQKQNKSLTDQNIKYFDVQLEAEHRLPHRDLLVLAHIHELGGVHKAVLQVLPFEDLAVQDHGLLRGSHHNFHFIPDLHVKVRVEREAAAAKVDGLHGVPPGP